MFRIDTYLNRYKDLLRNIYKIKRYCILGVVEFNTILFFPTLQLPLSSLIIERNSSERLSYETRHGFNTLGLLRRMRDEQLLSCNKMLAMLHENQYGTVLP
jgi:hypothetical protein